MRNGRLLPALLAWACLLGGSSALADDSQDIQLENGLISADEGRDGNPSPASSFFLQDHIYFFTEVSGAAVGNPAVKHRILYKWYTGDREVFHFDGPRIFDSNPYRWSAWISGTHLGEGHHRGEVYVDGKLIDSREFDIIPRTANDEQTQRDLIAKQAQSLLLASDMAGLDKVATSLRTGQERTPAGFWKLHLLYKSATDTAPGDARDPIWEKAELAGRQWLDAHPDSPSAVIIAASTLYARAWAYRGEGFSDRVKQDRWGPYDAGIEDVRKILDEHASVGSRDPEWGYLRLRIAREQGADSDAVIDIARKALERQPDYDPISYGAVAVLHPKWGGSAEAIKNYLNMALQLSHAKEGTQIYARFYLSMIRNTNQPIDELNLLGAKWPAMKQSLNEIIHAYPNEYNVEAARSMACYARAPADYRSYGRRSKPSGAIGWWDTPEWRKQCDEWAFEGKQERHYGASFWHSYYTFLLGFGDELWNQMLLIAWIIWLGLELIFLWLDHRRSRTSKIRVPYFGEQLKFDPTQYPCSYRFADSSQFVGIRAVVRFSILAGTAAWLTVYTLADRDLSDAIVPVSACLIVVLLGLIVLLRRLRRRVVLHPDSIEIFGLLRRRELRRSQIAGRRQKLAGQRFAGILLVAKPLNGTDLLVAPVLKTDQAFQLWFSSLPDLNVEASGTASPPPPPTPA